jgi:hypothetical protein
MIQVNIPIIGELAYTSACFTDWTAHGPAPLKLLGQDRLPAMVHPVSSAATLTLVRPALRAYSCGVCMSSVTSCVGGGLFICFTCLHVPYSTVTLLHTVYTLQQSSASYKSRQPAVQHRQHFALPTAPQAVTPPCDNRQHLACKATCKASCVLPTTTFIKYRSSSS